MIEIRRRYTDAVLYRSEHATTIRQAVAEAACAGGAYLGDADLRGAKRRHGPRRAGAMIYRASTGRVPHFFATDARALADIRERAAEQAARTEVPS